MQGVTTSVIKSEIVDRRIKTACLKDQLKLGGEFLIVAHGTTGENSPQPQKIDAH